MVDDKPPLTHSQLMARHLSWMKQSERVTLEEIERLQWGLAKIREEIARTERKES
jgi:phenylpyruvate tautomerase PptA (4-oxalocrotonate tautomerase family)